MMTEVTRERVSEALFLIGLGVIWAFDLWWPGIIVAFGVSWSASLAIRRRYWATVVIATLLGVVPAVYLVAQAWSAAVPAAVVGLGIAGLVRAAYLHSSGQS